jgi:YdjC-like protein.
MNLIINTDDLGISEKMNNTILMMHEQGIVKYSPKFGPLVKLKIIN